MCFATVFFALKLRWSGNSKTPRSKSRSCFHPLVLCFYPTHFKAHVLQYPFDCSASCCPANEKLLPPSAVLLRSHFKSVRVYSCNVVGCGCLIYVECYRCLHMSLSCILIWESTDRTPSLTESKKQQFCLAWSVHVSPC